MTTQRYSSLDELIHEHSLDKDCTMSPEAVRHYARLAMVTNSLAYILADAAETFLMDCDYALQKFDRHLQREVKHDFRQMQKAVHFARAAARKAAMPMYHTGSSFTDDACIDSDWWYNFVKLLDDRVGVNPQKTQLLLEFLLAMPSEGENLFNPKLDDFYQK